MPGVWRDGEAILSAKGRGTKSGGPDDVYPTPAWCVQRLLEVWHPRPGAILEPAAGDGAIIRAAKAVLAADHNWYTVECRATCEQVLIATGARGVDIADFRSWRPRNADVARQIIQTVLTNPPYTMAEEMVRHAREIAPDADIVMLLRLGFLSSAERVEFYKVIGTPDLYVLPNRPGFTFNGKTDQTDYAWFIWPAGPPREAGMVRHLAETPRAIRRPPRPRKVRAQKKQRALRKAKAA